MISKLQLKNFTGFQESDFSFSKGLNVFIGENSVGKTNLLKVMAALLKGTKANQTKDQLENTLAERLIGYFKPEQLGRLVQRKRGRGRAEISLTSTSEGFFDDIKLHCHFSTNSTSRVQVENYEALKKDIQRVNKTSCLYLPPREIISVFEGFIPLYEKREVSFDESYYDLALALSTPTLRGRRSAEIDELITKLEEATDGKVIFENGRFYTKNTYGKMEMPLVAEGYRKLATLIHLLANGELSKQSVLFWDEPEANLNPKLIHLTAAILRKLASIGVQVFVATHDFLLVQLLSLEVEYKKEAAPPVSFFSLYRDAESTVKYDKGEKLADLEHNILLEEFTRYYNLEAQYFNESMK
jgi:predicted ATPase